MNDPLKKMIAEMSLDALMDIVDLIKDRPDIASVIVTTMKEVEEMDVYYKLHYEKHIGRINEPA